MGEILIWSLVVFVVLAGPMLLGLVFEWRRRRKGGGEPGGSA